MQIAMDLLTYLFFNERRSLLVKIPLIEAVKFFYGYHNNLKSNLNKSQLAIKVSSQ